MKKYRIIKFNRGARKTLDDIINHKNKQIVYEI